MKTGTRLRGVMSILKNAQRGEDEWLWSVKKVGGMWEVRHEGMDTGRTGSSEFIEVFPFRRQAEKVARDLSRMEHDYRVWVGGGGDR